MVLHDSTMRALDTYGRLRDRRFPRPRCDAFLVSVQGTRLVIRTIHWRFARLVQTAGLKPRSPGCRPRLHDFRHGFAVRTLLEWYRDGLDVQARLPLLSNIHGARLAGERVLVPDRRARAARARRRPLDSTLKELA